MVEKRKLDKDMTLALTAAIRGFPEIKKAPEEKLDDESFIRGFNAGIAIACHAVELAHAFGIKIPEQEKE